jgi:hypothetical protein
MAIPFNNQALLGPIWLALNNKETFEPLMSYIDDQLSAATPTTLAVGTVDPNYYQYGYEPVGHATWFDADGVNPPTAPVFRVIDQLTGAYVYVGVYNGALFVAPTL